MSTRETQFPAIPDVLGKSGSEGAFNRSVKETLDVGIGRIGDPLDRFARVRDLVTLGLAEFSPGQSGAAGAGLRPRPGNEAGGGFPGIIPPGSIVRPTIINGIRTRAVWNGIGISFDWPDPPAGGLFQEWLSVEIWGAFWGDSPNGITLPTTPRPSFQAAQSIGTTATNYFLHDLGPDGFGKVWVYWLRFTYIVRPGLPQQYGPWNPLEVQPGIVGMSAPSPEALVRALQERVTADLLALGLRDTIALGDLQSAATQGIGSINSRVLAVGAQATSGIQQVAALREGVQGALSGSYSVRVQLGGPNGQTPYVAGFGLIATRTNDPLNPLAPPTFDSSFIVLADRFAIVPPNAQGETRTPFFVADAAGGIVGIDGRLVVNGTISGNAIQAQTIGAREISAQSLFANFFTGNQVVGGTVRTAGDQNWRATMNGIDHQDGAWPFWYGSGPVGEAGTVFGLRFDVTQNVGDVLLNGDMIVGGRARIRSAGGGDARIEVGGDDYLLWAGSGPLNDDNGKFFIRLDGTPVIRGIPVTFPVGSGNSTCSINVVPPVGSSTAKVAVIAMGVITSGLGQQLKTYALNMNGSGFDRIAISTREETTSITSVKVFDASAGTFSISLSASVGTGPGGQTPSPATLLIGRIVMLQVEASTG